MEAPHGASSNLTQRPEMQLLALPTRMLQLVVSMLCSVRDVSSVARASAELFSVARTVPLYCIGVPRREVALRTLFRMVHGIGGSGCWAARRNLAVASWAQRMVEWRDNAVFAECVNTVLRSRRLKEIDIVCDKSNVFHGVVVSKSVKVRGRVSDEWLTALAEVVGKTAIEVVIIGDVCSEAVSDGLVELCRAVRRAGVRFLTLTGVQATHEVWVRAIRMLRRVEMLSINGTAHTYSRALETLPESPIPRFVVIGASISPPVRRDFEGKNYLIIEGVDTKLSSMRAFGGIKSSASYQNSLPMPQSLAVVGDSYILWHHLRALRKHLGSKPAWFLASPSQRGWQIVRFSDRG